MDFSNENIERLLRVALSKTEKYEIDPSAFTNLYRESVAQVQEENKNNVVNIYKNIQPQAFFIESFQVKTHQFGSHPKVRTQRVRWNEIYAMVNSKFGENLKDDDRGRTKTFVWLEDHQGIGKLSSYGQSHYDWTGRNNMHYFSIAANTDELQKALDSFIEEPSNLQVFVDTTLRWGEVEYEGRFHPTNLFENLKYLNVHTPKLGVVMKEVENNLQ